ncbi:GNAT family N-acetyltransferase [Thermodesulfobacteriota bacterium]
MVNWKLNGFGGLHYIAGMEDVNIGYAFEKKYWRKGFGFETCQAILEFGQSVLDLSHIIAVIWPQNTASIRLIEKCGLRFWKKIIWSGSDRVVYRIDFSDNS